MWRICKTKCKIKGMYVRKLRNNRRNFNQARISIDHKLFDAPRIEFTSNRVSNVDTTTILEVYY
jgi:hypothetical protein